MSLPEWEPARILSDGLDAITIDFVSNDSANISTIFHYDYLDYDPSSDSVSTSRRRSHAYRIGFTDGRGFIDATAEGAIDCPFEPDWTEISSEDENGPLAVTHSLTVVSGQIIANGELLIDSITGDPLGDGEVAFTVDIHRIPE